MWFRLDSDPQDEDIPELPEYRYFTPIELFSAIEGHKVTHLPCKNPRKYMQVIKKIAADLIQLRITETSSSKYTNRV